MQAYYYQLDQERKEFARKSAFRSVRAVVVLAVVVPSLVNVILAAFGL